MVLFLFDLEREKWELEQGEVGKRFGQVQVLEEVGDFFEDFQKVLEVDGQLVVQFVKEDLGLGDRDLYFWFQVVLFEQQNVLVVGEGEKVDGGLLLGNVVGDIGQFVEDSDYGGKFFFLVEKLVLGVGLLFEF